MKILYNDGCFYSIRIMDAGMYHTKESWKDNKLHYCPQTGVFATPYNIYCMSVPKAYYLARKMKMGGMIQNTILKCI